MKGLCDNCKKKHFCYEACEKSVEWEPLPPEDRLETYTPKGQPLNLLWRRLDGTKSTEPRKAKIL